MFGVIDIQWVGHRKDGSPKGAVLGWFVKTGTPNTPPEKYWSLGGLKREAKENIAYVFWGRIGKKLHIEERSITDEFLDEMRAKESNYKQVSTEKIASKWGKLFEEEFSMQALMMKVRG